MPVRTSVQNESTSPLQSIQGSPSGLPRRSNSVTCPTATSEPSHRRLKRNRHGSGTSVSSPDSQPVPRKSRRNRSSAENSIHESPEISELISERSRKCFTDSSESDSNSRMEVLKTVVQEVVDTEDVSGTQTPQSNDEEGNNSENDDEQVAKLPHEPVYDSSPDPAPIAKSSCENDNATNQRSLLNSSPNPSNPIVPRSISCDPSIPSSSSKPCSIYKNDPSMDVAFRQFPKTCLSSFSSVTSLIDSVMGPFSIASSPVISQEQEKSAKTDSGGFCNSKTGDITSHRKCKRKSESISSSKPPKIAPSPMSSSDEVNNDGEIHVYPLRSRLRIEQQRKEWEDRLNQPRNLDTLPMELILRIVQYLSVQDLFAMQSLSTRLQHACRYHLAGLRRINFSSGLPFAYLPDKLDDAALSHILRCTPEVTHILGFYPRVIYKAGSPEVKNLRHALTYEGILSAFQSCSKLRSVELMDVGLMSLLVRQMPTVKFHGMFRNRPDSWDSEYAVPLPPEVPPRPSVSLIQSSVSPSFNGPTQSVVRFVNQQASRSARLARWFEPVTEAPIIQGSPMAPVFPFIYPPRAMPTQQQSGSDENSLHNSMLMFAIASANIHQDGSQSRSESSQSRRSRSGAVSSPNRRQSLTDFMPVFTTAASAAAFIAHSEGKPPPYPPVSPFHLTRSMPITLPEAIVNLTKLDLVAVPVTILPRLDNVKYLHLKWVYFSDQDPFLNFQASKLQSFVMNNCVGPRRYVRFIRLFVFLTRATQIMRLELVGTRLVEGLFEQLIDRQVVPPAPCFRNLQRLVMTGDRDITISDAGLILFCAQQSLTHLALQTFHSDNSLFEALNFARVRLSRLESLILGYQDPYLSRLTPGEIHELDLCDSPDSTSPFCSITNRGLTLALSVCPRINNLTLRQAPYITRFPRSEEILASFPSPSSPANNPGSNLSAPNPPTAPTSVPSQPNQQLYVNAISALTAMGLQPSHSNTSAPTQSETTQHRITQPSNAQQRSPSPIGSQLILRLATMRPGVPVKSLTLENCPGLTATEIENMIARGDPFGVLESLILRDMFPVSRTMYNQTAAYNWSSQWLSNPNSTEIEPIFSFLNQENADYRKLGLLLTISDLLASKLIAQPSLAQFGIGMGTSVRDVVHVPAFQGARVVDLPIQPFDTFFILRTHTYLTTLLQMDGSVGNLLRIPRLLYGGVQTCPPETKDEDLHETCFASRATQTCICGLLEWDFFHRMCAEGTDECEISSPPKQTTEASGQESTSPFNVLYQIGGPLAFHPHFVLSQHGSLFQKVLCGSWGEKISKSRAFEHLKNTRCLVKPFYGSSVCQGCSSDLSDAPSRTQAEHSLSPKPRVWTARDACVDTSDLRCHIGPKPCVLTLRQPFNYPFNCLTTLHLEKVGISHLVLSGVPRLKNITLENCPILTSILLASVTVPSNSSKMVEAAPSLKRVRIIRCPKFAIWNWLAIAASLYPQHDENLFITYRPFGAYNELVEQALWRKTQGAHVTVSHDYSIDRSERAMEETNSAFEQRFRELMHLTDLINIGPNPEVEISKDRNTKDFPTLTRLFHTDRGDNWNLMTDASWMPKGALNPTIEVSLNNPVPPNDIIQGAFEESEMQLNENPPSNDEIRESEAQKRKLFARFLNEYRSTYRFHRRGVHFHVQHRDIHAGIVDGDKDGQYLTWPYTDSYLKAMSPEDDFNVYGDGHDVILREQLPPRFPSTMCGESASSSTIMKREHCSEPEKDEEIEEDIKHSRLDVLEDCDNCPKEDRTQTGEANS